MGSKDLEGLLVVSLEQAVAAPYASSRLALAGARVIKVERPEGDFARSYDDAVFGESAYFVWLNRGKESICLNIKDPEDRQLFMTIVHKADVFIHNLAPGALARLNITAQSFLNSNPGLIFCEITGYGTKGPLANRKAYDLLIQAETGLSSINGTKDELARVGVSVSDIAAGMTAFQAILQALIGRSRTGKGRIIDLSLFSATADWMNVPYLQYQYGGIKPRRSGLHHPTIAPYGAYECAGRQSVIFSIQNEREWARFCDQILQRPDLSTNPMFDNNKNRVANRAALDAMILERFADIERCDLTRLLEKAGIAFASVTQMEDLCDHPQLRFTELTINGEQVALIDTGAAFFELDGSVLSKPASVGEGQNRFHKIPATGEHSQAIRTEFSNQVAD